MARRMENLFLERPIRTHSYDLDVFTYDPLGYKNTRGDVVHGEASRFQRKCGLSKYAIVVFPCTEQCVLNSTDIRYTVQRSFHAKKKTCSTERKLKRFKTGKCEGKIHYSSFMRGKIIRLAG